MPHPLSLPYNGTPAARPVRKAMGLPETARLPEKGRCTPSSSDSLPMKRLVRLPLALLAFAAACGESAPTTPSTAITLTPRGPSFDDIANTVDATIDATIESMALQVGGPAGSTTLIVQPRNGDGDNGCNFQGTTEALTVSVASSNVAVATVSPASVTFTSCSDTKTLTVTPVAQGTAAISLTQTANNTGGTFNLAPATFTVNVTAATPTNTAPTANVGGPYSVDEGSPITLNLSGSDPDVGDVLQYSWNLGDGTTGSGTTPPSSHTYVDNAASGTTYTISLTVTDSKGASDTKLTTVAVANVVPTVNAGPDVANVNKKVAYTLGGASFSDPGADSPWAYVVDWGDGTANTTGTASTVGALSGITHSYATSGAYTVTVTVTDKDGASGSDTKLVTVINRAPVITSMGGPYATPENGSVTFAANVSDPDGDDLTYAWNFGDGGTSTAASPSHQYKDDDADDSYTATLIVTDVENASSSQSSVAVTVTNVNPVISGIVVPTAPIPAGQEVTVAATYTDVGTLDTHSGTIIWDIDALSGSTFATPTAATSVSGGTATFKRVLPAGVYTVKVTLLDDDGGTAVSTATSYIVVFDATGGFVTGGGWIDSPEGALTGSTAVGKANFGFNAKYQRGASVPTGNTEFQFHAGALDFKSTSFEWLVVAGARAQFKGVGRIKGQVGEFQFLLTAVDAAIAGGGTADKFRIKITGATGVVYDNGLGANDDSDSGSALKGGNISIKP